MKKNKERNKKKTREKTPYEILEVSETSALKEIKKAYLKKVKLSPPEKDPEGFKIIHRAYTILKDGAKRKTLDFSILKTSSELNLNLNIESDFIQLFKDRIFQLLLVSSDLYKKDFSAFFKYIDDKIRNLN